MGADCSIHTDPVCRFCKLPNRTRFSFDRTHFLFDPLPSPSMPIATMNGQRSALHLRGAMHFQETLGGEISDRQWQDILNMLKIQGERIDWTYLKYWVALLGCSDLLARALQ